MLSYITPKLLSCATCMSGRGEASADASGGAIIFMLAILVLVFGGVFQFMRYLHRCEKNALAAAQRG